MKNRLSVFAALCALVCLIAASEQVISGCREGLRLCVELILPSLFPFFVVSGLLVRLGFPQRLGRVLGPGAGKLFHVSGCGVSALFIGLCGGYPLGAAYLADLMRDGAIPKEEGGHLLSFCNNSGPAFIIGAVGIGVFASVKIGLLLYSVHILAAMLTGFLLRGRSRPFSSQEISPLPSSGLAEALPEAVRSAVLAILNVCGFVTCFSVLTGLLDAEGWFSLLSGFLSARLGTELHWCRALLTGFWELGGGIGALRGLGASPRNLALAAGILGWGGISVHFQTLAMLADLDVKSAPHTAGRLLSAIFSSLLAWLLSPLL